MSRTHLFRPASWGIAARSAAVSAVVVTVSLALATAILLALLYGSLMSTEDDRSAARVSEIVTALAVRSPGELDSALLDGTQPPMVVQIVDADGRVLRDSTGVDASPIVSIGLVGPQLLRGLAGQGESGSGLRVSGQTAVGTDGVYTVLVGFDTASVTGTVRSAAVLLAAATPFVLVETAFVNFLLVKRSMQSVDAIRSRVADISASDLTGRVPVPTGGDEIAALAWTMNEMLERVEAGHLAQQRFVGDASHELRSPLAGIVSTLEVVEAHPQLLSYDLVVGKLLPQAHRMTALVDDLLLLARADENALAKRKDVIDLRDLIAVEVVRLRDDTSLIVTAEVDPMNLVGDRIALSRVLRNLVDNAARHAKTRVDVVARSRDDDVVIEVSDDGPGIPEADRVRVFDRFVRLDSDRARRGGGTGLGLAIVAEIVASHHGIVTVDARPGGGAKVVVTLPCW